MDHIGFYTDYNFVFNFKKNRLTTSTQLYKLYIIYCHITHRYYNIGGVKSQKKY